MAHMPATPLDRQLRRVRRRMFLQTLLQTLLGCWLASFACSMGWILAEPFVVPGADPALRWTVVGGLLGVFAGLAIVLAVRRAPSRLAAALALDERFQLKERATTALTLSQTELASPAGQASSPMSIPGLRPFECPIAFRCVFLGWPCCCRSSPGRRCCWRSSTSQS